MAYAGLVIEVQYDTKGAVKGYRVTAALPAPAKAAADYQPPSGTAEAADLTAAIKAAVSALAAR